MEITLLGDISLNGKFITEPGLNKERFGKITPLLQQKQFVFANLESPVFGNGELNEEKNFHIFTTKNTALEILPMLHLCCVSLANNHIFDCKSSGLTETIHVLDQLKIKHTGAGSLPEHTDPVFINTHDGTIGFMAYVEKQSNVKIKNDENVLINYFEPEKVINDISKIREKCAYIIISIHWGNEFSFYPTQHQTSICKSLSGAGATVIMGHHTHTLQPFSKIGNSYIFYSLGSFFHGDWVRNNEIKSLPLKSKISSIANIKLDIKSIDQVFVKSQKDNYLIVLNSPFMFKLRQYLLWKIFLQFSVYRYIVRINENFTDKIIDYFFGYYKNPFKQLIKFMKNMGKIKTALEEYSNYKTYK